MSMEFFHYTVMSIEMLKLGKPTEDRQAGNRKHPGNDTTDTGEVVIILECK